MDLVKSHGVRLVFQRDISHQVIYDMSSPYVLQLFHSFGEILYEQNIVEQEKWQPGQYYLASLNFGSLSSHQAFQVRCCLLSLLTSQDIFFNDPAFGNKRSNFLESVEEGCDYCFWMIHYRSVHDDPPFSMRPQEPAVADSHLPQQPNLDRASRGQP